MTRKGEIGRAQIKRRWPHRVELPAEAVCGPENSAATFGVAKALGAAPYPLSAFHDDRFFAVFHFSTAQAAQAFHARFGGELLPVVEGRSRMTPATLTTGNATASAQLPRCPGGQPGKRAGGLGTKLVGHFRWAGRAAPARAPSKSSLSRDVDVDLDISRTCSATRRLFLDMDFESIVPDKSRRWRIGNEALVSFLGRYAQNTMCRFHDRLKHCNLANPTRSEKSDLTRLSGKRACLHMGCAVDGPNEARADTADVGGRC